MASRHQIIFLVLGVLLLGGFADVQNQEIEGVEAAKPGLAQILKPKQQQKPTEQVGGGDKQSAEVQAGAPLGTGENAGGAAGEIERQEEVPFFGTKGEDGGPPNMAGEGGGDVGSNEAGGAAVEATGNADQNDAEEEEEEQEAAEVADPNEENEGEGEAGDTGTQGGAPVVVGGDAENPQMGYNGYSPFFAVNDGQQDGQEQVDQGEGGVEVEEGNAQEAAEIGATGDESSEEAQTGAIGDAQLSGGNTESGEQALGGAAGEQGGLDTESVDEVEVEVDAEESKSPTSIAVPSDGGVPSNEGGAIEVDQQTNKFVKPNLVSSLLLADKAKQLAPTGTTLKPEPISPTPKLANEETENKSSGLSDSDKIRIVISVSAVGAVVFVGVVAYLIGRNVSRRPHTGA